MTVRTLLMTALALVALAAPAAAQTAVVGRATVTIPDVLRLTVADGVVDGAGEAELVRLDVVANRGWELMAVLEDGAGRSWSAGSVAAGRAGRVPVELSYRALLAASGAPEGASPRFTLSAL